MKIVEPYQVRFIKPEQIGELVQLYHLARTALSDKPSAEQTPYYRMMWASCEFHRTHPQITQSAAYKDLCGLLDR